MVPLSWFRVIEPQVESGPPFREYMAGLWTLLRSKAMFWVLIYSFFNTVIANITTTAGADVKKYWAEVHQLQKSLFSLLGQAIFAFGLWITKKYFLDYSWRCMLITTTIFLN